MGARVTKVARQRLAKRRATDGTSRGTIDSARNLEIDEEHLYSNRWGVRAAFLSDGALSLGVGQSISTTAAVRARQLGIPVLKRRSGGTGLLHQPGDLTWSLVLPRSHPLVGNDFASAYPRLGAGVVDWLSDLGITARWSAPFSISGSYCLLGGRGQVLTTDGQALGGAAQHVTRSALLHHGTILGRLDRALLATLFDVDGAVLDASLTSLSELGVRADPSGLVSALGVRLGRSVGPSGFGGPR
ncbi:MAG: hypothetical protein L3J95_05475 [Thermoplasmata archaeon]|nr:hypothetical protein [Thermoplasmata archaeon]MCI4359849.1 hypothetical protein [Thermoplasmata archaeon]